MDEAEWKVRTRCEGCGRFFVPESESEGELCISCHEDAATGW